MVHHSTLEVAGSRTSSRYRGETSLSRDKITLSESKFIIHIAENIAMCNKESPNRHMRCLISEFQLIIKKQNRESIRYKTPSRSPKNAQTQRA
ncbi:hypothetical protein EYC84_002420 [Monilinia fructicola]|uniref:Uncharacterized protein n=1 Tax=Monilinia fructicola TaxID=38448 RepID=A0A5M9JQK1_MONFR|nr:hypothetical protein EYC84_002420 [Monilinia fructicola]